tara:strand:+ start:2568 stop:2852 length:285 start_codon:yes stop_codon:yes gene_type:complete
MINYLVIGICIFLLIAVIYISAKPVSMGIEARRNINNKNKDDNLEVNEKVLDNELETSENTSISDEIIKLNKLKNDGIITEEEYLKAKEKLLSS